MVDKLESWIHPSNSGIRIRQKINARGTVAFGTSYVVTVPTKLTGGALKRKQFTSREQAEAFAEDEWSGFRRQGEVYFDATPDERNQFASILPRLRASGIGLVEAIDFALPRLRPAGGDRTASDVIEELRASKKGMLERGILREDSEKAFRLRSEKVVEAFGNLPIRELTLDDVRIWLGSMDLAPRTIKNELNCLTEIIRYSVARKYSVENILDGLTAGDRREIYGNDEEREPEILTVNEADRLLTAAVDHPELDLLAPIVLGLFCGIRTEELKKLQWQHVNLEEGFVTIGRDIAKKRRIRNVTLPENAKQWLSICSDREGEITRSNFFCDFDRRFNKLLRHAGFVEKDEDGNVVRVAWKKNGMRHSFGSYHFALHADSIKTSNELGHRQGDNVLFEHYRALTTKKSGQQYFNLKPSASAKKVVAFAS